jgi:hypothetical protein
MLMVIFGAGASYDSSPDFPPPQPQAAQQNFGSPSAPPNPRESWRPPLATQLFLDPNGVFGDIVANPNYRKLLPILSRLRQPRNGSVEQELESLLAEANADVNGDSERKRQLFAVRYYLHDLLLKVTSEWLNRTNGVTNYVSLLDQIRSGNTAGEPVCLVTFNYDLLLDRALLSFGYRQLDPDKSFFAHPNFKLLKPHGSVDWARYVDVPPDTRMGIEQVIEQADRIKLTKEYLLANAAEAGSIYGFARPIVPAIAVPVQRKTDDTFEWPQSQRDALMSYLPSITKVLIIGWQAKEAHFLQMLRDNIPGRGRGLAILVVGKDAVDGKAILDHFASELGQSGYNPNYACSNGGFTKFVGNREGEVFLRP